MFNEKIEQIFINIIVEVLKSKDIHIDLNSNFTLDDLYEKILSSNKDVEFYFTYYPEDQQKRYSININSGILPNHRVKFSFDIINETKYDLYIKLYDYTHSDKSYFILEFYKSNFKEPNYLYESETNIVTSFIDEFEEYYNKHNFPWNIIDYIKQLD